MSDSWLEEFADDLRDVRVRFWVCPVRAHAERRDARGWPVVTVEWRDGVAYCTTPDCGRTSIDAREVSGES